MRAAKRHEGADGRKVAPLDVGAQKDPSLTKAEGVDCRRRRQDRVGRHVGADLLELGCHVAVKGGGAVRVCVADVDRVDEGAGIDRLGELADLADPVIGKGVAEAWQQLGI